MLQFTRSPESGEFYFGIDTRRHPLEVHLRQRRHRCLLRALIALEQLRREATLPVARHAQL